MTGLRSLRADTGVVRRVKVWPSGRVELFRFVMSLLLAVSATASVLVVPLVVGSLIESLSSGSPDVASIVLMVCIVIGSSVGSAVSTVLVSKFAVSMVESARNRVMSHSLKLPIADVSSFGVGRILNLIAIDGGRLRNLVDAGLIQLVVAGISVTGTLTVMVVIAWTLVVITLCSFTAAAVIVIVVIARVRAHHHVVQQRTAELSEDFSSALRSLPVIKAYREESNVAARLSSRTTKVAAAEAKAAVADSLMSPAIVVAQQIALVSVVTIGAARVASEAISMGSFIAFILYLLQLTGPLIMGASGLSNMQTGLVSRKAIDSHLNIDVESAGGSISDELSEGFDLDTSVYVADNLASQELVIFDKVSFSYGHVPVLQNLSLRIAATGITAIVGPSGSGKSTVLSIMERFNEIDAGSVLFAGSEILSWDLFCLRSRISYLNQDSSLVVGTVRENLMLGIDGGVSEGAIWRSLGQVCLAERVRRLPAGLDTVIGGGVELSGGERQRLALARVFMVDRPLVLLDEPTSSVDSNNERSIVESLAELSTRCSVVVVTHKSAIVEAANTVITVEGGRVQSTLSV